MPHSLVSLKSEAHPSFSAELLGGKGFNLWKMAQSGLPVPPAHIITTEVCRMWMKDPAKVEAWLKEEAIPIIADKFQDEFGFMPLVSVRSGAAQSMPGMMDTILNVGMYEGNFVQWSNRIGMDCAKDSYMRLIEMYAGVVHGVDRSQFHGLNNSEMLLRYQAILNQSFPAPKQQWFEAIVAVFKSWNSERAVIYRDLNKIAHDGGTAVTIQAMVFGNFNSKSATGVIFSRDWASGENEVVGDFVVNGQGEDVVAGYSDKVQSFENFHKWNAKVGDELLDMVDKLEGMYRDMQDIEFTVQDGKLWLLQTRVGKRTALAALRIAVDMAEVDMITKQEAVDRVSARQVLLASRPVIDPKWVKVNPPHGKGVAASVGTVIGKAVFSSEAAMAAVGPVVLVKETTDPKDIGGMAASAGFLTRLGGGTCHAAVVARAMDKVAVVGCADLTFCGDSNAILWNKDPEAKHYDISEGTPVALDGATGDVWIGVEPPVVGGAKGAVKDFLRLLSEVYGYYEVAVKADDIINPERVVLPAYLLGVAELEAEFTKMYGFVKELIVDLRDVVIDPASVPLAGLWGAPDSQFNDKVLALVAAKKYGKKPIKFISDQPSVLDDADSGWVKVPVIKSFPHLQMVTGMVVADHSTMADYKKDELMAVVKKNSIVSLNCVSSLDRKAAKSGAKFAVIPMLAAMSLLD